MDDHALIAAVRTAYEITVDDIPERVRRMARSTGFAELSATVASQQTVRFERVLAPAAATGARVLSGTFTGGDHRFRTHTFETEDEHLVLTVSADQPFDGLLRVRWTCVSAAGVPAPRSLVTPLVSIRDGWAAGYDLGRVSGYDAVDVTPAEPIEQDQITDADVHTAFGVTQHGSADRAWRRALADHRLEPHIATIVTSYLHMGGPDVTG